MDVSVVISPFNQRDNLGPFVPWGLLMADSRLDSLLLSPTAAFDKLDRLPQSSKSSQLRVLSLLKTSSRERERE
jgi:hypothetical protein